jgi:antitoxin component YwqK of YwqJK toxin-antitoxin module
MDGLFISWHENGQKKSEGEYKAGIKQGNWVSWDEKGDVKEK